MLIYTSYCTLCGAESLIQVRCDGRFSGIR